MKPTLACLIALLVACAPAHAIHKCVAKDGKVTYSDVPCPGNSTQSPVPAHLQYHRAGGSPKVVTVATDGGPTYRVGIPATWRDSLVHPQGGATLRVEATGNETLSMTMTFFDERQSVGADAPVLERMMAGIDAQHRNGNERRVASEPVRLVLAKGVGRLNTYEDLALSRQRNRPAGEFPLMTTGVVIIDGWVVTATILSNDRTSDAYAKAVAAIDMLAL